MSPVKFLFGFLILSIILWMLFMFASGVLAWVLSRIMGATIRFRVGGWKCLRDIDLKFNKGAVESVSVAEIRLSLRQSLVKLGVGFFSKEPKLQVLISDIEVVIRPSKTSSRKSKSRRSSTSGRGSSGGRGKWMVMSMARFLSVSITELIVKVPKANIDIKELSVDISKDAEPNQGLSVKLRVLPIVVHLGETGIMSDHFASSNDDGTTSGGHASSLSTARTSASFCCEEFYLLSEIGYDRETGIVIKNLDVTSGEVSLNLDEELFAKKKSLPGPLSATAEVEEPSFEYSSTAKKTEEKQKVALSMKKYASIIPEKISFSLPKLDVKFVHKGLDLVVENNIMGIQVKSIKSRSVEDLGESTRLDIQMDFSEIHLVREASISVLEILKVAVVFTSYIPLQPMLPIRSEVDVKLGGTQCNIILSRITPWLQLKSSKKKSMVLQTETAHLESVHVTKPKCILWTCTVSAPEMAIVLYSLKSSPLYHGCSQSSHVFANNISSTGTSVHMELGEVNLVMADEYQECLKESLFGVETNTGSLIHINRVSLDWGKKDTESLPEEEAAALRSKLVLSVDVTGMGIFLTLKRVESIISAAMSFKSLLKNNNSNSNGKSRQTQRHSSKKGMQLLQLNLERCSINFSGDVALDNSVVPDPKRVNYGSQGGRVVVSVLADGTPRNAHIMSTQSEDWEKVKYSVSLDFYYFSLCINKEKQSTQVDLKRAKSVYQEYSKDASLGTSVSLFDMQNAKFVRRSGGIKELDICSLFSSSDVTVRWEPDVHLALFELFLRVKLCIHNYKVQSEYPSGVNSMGSSGNEQKTRSLIQSTSDEKQNKKRESLFAIDVEMLNISAEVGDGIEATVQVQSIFSENASIGVLLEGLTLKFNEARIFKSSRMQISRIPNVSSGSSSSTRTEIATSWDWIIQGLDFHICMPYRLHLRAIDDAVEDMLRALKLISAAKTKLIFPFKKESSTKIKKHSNRIGRVKFSIRRLCFEIEEEPFQGWLDKHYRLMKYEACERAVRLKFLDDIVLKSRNGDNKEFNHDSKIMHSGEELDLLDGLAIEKMKEEIYKQSFRNYYLACKNLAAFEGGSGACRNGFQVGFKPSACRNSLFSVTATELELSLTRIEGGDAGMIEVIQKLDPVSREYNIPFSRLYGSNILLRTGSLVVQIRDYTHPLLSGTSGRCDGRIVLAQQATRFQPQITQDVFVGRWRKVCMCRSASGTTPPIKTYSDFPLHFQTAEISFGVGFEPSFADISYAFSVALRRANLSVRNPNASDIQPPKKERSLPWWDDMRNYIHGKITLIMSEAKWNVLATTDPYEKCEKLQIISGHMELHQSDGCIYCSAKEFKIILSSLEILLRNCGGLKVPTTSKPVSFITSPSFALQVTMDWECDSGNPMNHYLFALPNEVVPREKVFDPFRSTSLSLRWDFSLRPTLSSSVNQQSSAMGNDDGVVDGRNISTALPVMILGAHDLAWLIKFWNMNYLPPQKLRSFSRWPRFGVPRVARSGNLSLDKVMTEFMFRIDVTPTLIKNMPLDDDDPAKGLTFKMAKLKYELCYSRGKQRYTYESKRDPLDLVYQGLDLHMPKAFINKDDNTSVTKLIQLKRRSSKSMDKTNEKPGSSSEKQRDDGFLLTSDYFTIRRQAPKADPATLLAWQESGRRNPEMTYVRSEFENGSESDEHTRSDPSDDDGYNVVIADNCRRIFVYGLKLLWTLENRDAVWSWVGGISKAFEAPKASPSRQYAQRKLHEVNEVASGPEISTDDKLNDSSNNQASSSNSHLGDVAGSFLSPPHMVNVENAPFGKAANDGSGDDSEEEGTRHFMVNIIEPQFNLHSEEANGRFLLAAVSGRVLARSFHSVLHVGYEVIEKALGTGKIHAPENQPEMTWNRMEFSVMLEHVQAHVAPTDVDPGAGLQWLPKIRRSSPKVKRTGALLERVFMPCDMYFRYTRHKAGTADLKMKPLKELTFNSHNITATMTSRQFQVMLDVLTNLLFARLPKPRKSNLLCPAEEDEDVEEEADEVVPDGVEEVELAKINLEKKEREYKLLLHDIRKLSVYGGDTVGDGFLTEQESDQWMITSGRPTLVHRLKKELVDAKRLRKAASASLRMTLQNAAQLRLMEKEKNKTPSCAMRISMQMNKIVWSMLADGKSFAEAEINDMIYDFDRDYQDFGVARFTTKYFVVRNCLPNTKFDMILSPWNPPPEWGKKVMLRVDAKQGAPKDGNSPIETFQVEIYPLKIHLTETLYHMIWGYFFPEEEQDSQRRQDIWKVSTTAGSKRVKKGSSMQEASAAGSQSIKEVELSSKTNMVAFGSSSQPSVHADFNQGGKLQNAKASTMSGSTHELRRTSSLDRSWEECLAESVADELVLEAHSSSSRSGIKFGIEQQQPEEPSSKSKSKEVKATVVKGGGRYSHEEKKVVKTQEEKRSRPRKMRDFHNIKISQVELLVTYEGPPLSVTELRLLMDTFHRVDFTGTWRRLFSRVKKHVIWGVLKSVTGMQGKKFKDKAHSQRDVGRAGVPDSDIHLSDSDGGGKSGGQYPISWSKRPGDGGAGDGFVTSIRGLFNSQRRKAKAFVLRTMRGEAENEFNGDWSESDSEFSPFARQLTITKAKKLIRRHTKKFRSRGHKGSSSQQKGSLPSSPRETIFESDTSSGSSPYEDFHE